MGAEGNRVGSVEVRAYRQPGKAPWDALEESAYPQRRTERERTGPMARTHRRRELFERGDTEPRHRDSDLDGDGLGWLAED